MIYMATKSFLKNLNINNKMSASSFIDALEHAEGKGRKKVILDRGVDNIKDCEQIRRIFKR